LLAIDDKTVTFAYKDYKQKGKKKAMTLTHTEFIRRFSQHILPKRFVKIRHYGFLSSTWKKLKFKCLQEKFKLIPTEIKEKSKFKKCPCCKVGNLILKHSTKEALQKDMLWAVTKPNVLINNSLMGKGCYTQRG
jgi:Putative transposase